MNPGSLNRRICVQIRNQGQDALGSPLETWSTAYECWAAINIQTGKQLFSANQFVSKNTLDIIVRWTSSFVFAPNQRVLYKENCTGVVHTYNIEAISNPNQANRTVTRSVYELGGQE